jgi:hypothetical protein
VWLRGVGSVLLPVLGICVLAWLAVATSAAQTQAIQFSDATPLLGIPAQPEYSFGVIWGDADGDGWSDLFLNNHSPFLPYFLLNQSGAGFTDSTVDAGMTIDADNHGGQWADYDGDGDLDLYLSAGGQRGQGSSPAQLYQNNGDGTFSDVAVALGVDDGPGRGRTVNWLDLDADADLDLFVGNYANELDDPPHRLYRNDGAVFTDIAAEAGVAAQSGHQCSTLSDVDRDGDPDLLLSSGNSGLVKVYRNNGDSTFTALPPSSTRLQGSNIGELVALDYDNDGDSDLFAGSLEPGFARLYRNNGRGRYQDVTVGSGLESASAVPIFQSVALDADNNGFQDLFLVHGQFDGGPNPPDALYLNQGDGTFADATSGSGLEGTTEGVGEGAGVADFNRDGFLDILVANGYGLNPGPFQLFQNQGNSNHWFRLRLEGTVSNPQAIGSQVWIQAGGIRQYREYLDFGGCHSQNEAVAHFGLGTASTISQLRVQWPDGLIQEWRNLPIDRLATIVQPQ